MSKYFILTYVALFLVTFVNCADPPPITSSPNRPKGKFSLNRSTGSPPYWGTVFIDPTVLTDEDPNASRNRIKFKGRKCRNIWHSHLNEWVGIKTYTFTMAFKDKIKFHVWVDPKYGSMKKAKEMARKVTRILGSLPEFLRRHVHVIAILSEGEGANIDGPGGVITWHENTFNENGFDEEGFMHETAHTIIDNDMYGTTAWESAVQADPNYISQYAKDYPDREDVAESFVAWYALKSGRLNNDDEEKISTAIPNRVALFDDLYSNEDFYPVSGKKSGTKYSMPKKIDYNGGWYHNC